MPARNRAQGPVRTCVGCRTREQATGLLRVVAVDGALVPDPRGRLPGRGAWVHPATGCLDRAERRSAFPRALRVPGPLPVTAVRSYLDGISAAQAADPAGGQQEGAGTVPVPSVTEDKVDPS
ncbi:YlxR family protein [Pseudonocardia sp. NPDC049154]|uniref:YlxR family protein n=1 Tax=Pseudonocardia sp. NPDC049154 TaxID=3155501 RepID=UPI0033FDD1BC